MNAGDAAPERALAAARLADKADGFAGCHRQGNVADRLKPALRHAESDVDQRARFVERLREMTNLEQGSAHGRSSCRRQAVACSAPMDTSGGTTSIQACSAWGQRG